MIQNYKEHTPRVADSAYVHPSAVIIGEVAIGANSSVWPNATVRGDDGSITIGDNCSIQDGSVVHLTKGLSNTVVEDCVTVGHNVILHGCHVEEGSLIGMGAIIMDNARVGKQSLIGAGALVLQRMQIPPGSLVLGNPAQVVRPLSDEEIAGLAWSWRHYVERTEYYREHVK
jgi:carbonic anhydrase/acetyltransferase-like protein (isoleucine patch superfamily)